ncbi:hypothetical protein GPECTOR_13g820 [Gonium pectorale]|uniref:Photolyase/cryptochrome alpha/beta domain-containing protein n=1 Tax=Gonium pectorale TaxID=33097 RepID=A0A150GNB4_GONPE|nr:hypothetical protein GPECTOR_13g820 [Gonium pectorale]|eukprot:KXZ51333.1 hypothetical protein GPECTOR_13g820 [Gonium pectorale]
MAPGGFPRTGPARARFLLESLADLRARLRAAGSELVLARGPPEEVLPALAERVGAGAVYCCAEVTAEEAQPSCPVRPHRHQVESRVRSALERRGGELRAEWGGTLFAPEELPFRLDALPGTYAEFRARLAGRAVRQPLDSEAGLKGLPAGCSVEPGEMPTLEQLGVAQPATAGAAGRPFGAAVGTGGPPVRGGEGEALRNLQAFMRELKTSMAKAATTASSSTSSTGAAAAAAASSSSPSPSSLAPSSAFSCRISPWLALGCLSPRRMYHELRQQLQLTDGKLLPAPTPASQPAGKQQGRGKQQQQGQAERGSPANWLLFELLWRDFFRFMTQKYTNAARTAAAAAAGKAAASRGAVAGAARATTVAPSAAAVPAAPALALAAA